MKNMRVPSRPAPSLEDARQKQSQQHHNFLARFQSKTQQTQKKKPPPRPPPPSFENIKSNSSWNLLSLTTGNREPQQPPCLIDWSPPISPNASNKRAFAPYAPNNAGSISSSFSSSTSSLASSKKSFEYDAAFNISPWTNNSPSHRGPTIIRPWIVKKAKQNLSVSRNASPISSSSVASASSQSSSPVPPPNLPPPPSPPKHLVGEDEPDVSPFAIALYEYRTGHPEDLTFEVNDIIYLTERINSEWYRGRVDVQKGMFPATFVDVQVPLPNQTPKLATVLYTYSPNTNGYLNLDAGSRINVLYRVDADWCMGEVNDKRGQFPINHVDRLPEGI